MNKPRKHSNTHRAESTVLLALLIASAIFCIYSYALYKSMPSVWTEEYPIVNEHIVWTGAGYNGLWGSED